MGELIRPSSHAEDGGQLWINGSVSPHFPKWKTAKKGKAVTTTQFELFLVAAVGAITALNRMMALGADQKGFRGHSNHHYRRL